MPSNRLDILKSLLLQNPQDTFARYGIAMEYVNSGELEKATAEFEALLAVNPDYGAGYFHYGQTLEKLGRQEDAAAAYRRGIETTTRLGDAHTCSELQQALDMLG
jgi:tetratricopeptide (TPR) repeat protein